MAEIFGHLSDLHKQPSGEAVDVSFEVQSFRRRGWLSWIVAQVQGIFEDPRSKLSINFVLIDENRLRLQVLSKDNITTGTENDDTFYNFQIDLWWRDLIGWPEFRIRLPTLGTSINIPASSMKDFYQTELVLNEKKAQLVHLDRIVPRSMEIPRDIYTVWQDSSLEASPISIQKAIATWK